MSKKLIIFILIILVLGSAGFAYYRLLIIKPAATLEPFTQTTDNRNPFPVSAQATSTTLTTTTKNPDLFIVAPITETLAQLTTEPVSGAVFTTASSSLLIRYADRRTGNIFDINLSTSLRSRVSNITLPNIYESVWFTSGTKGIFRYQKNDAGAIQSYFFALGTPSRLNTLASSTPNGISYGYYLPQDITTLAIAPDATKVFYITDTADGSSGVIENGDTQKKTSVFASPFRDWTATWPNTAIITLTTKPTYSVPGYFYFLNPQTGALKSILGGINGLTTLTNPSGTAVVYGDAKLSLHLYNIKKATTTLTLPKTLPEKCIWSRKESNILYCAATVASVPGQFPDDWYQGTVSFSDNIYKIDTITGGLAETFTISDGTKKLDITNLVLSADEKYLLFTDKHDGTLWSLKLN